MKKSLLLPLLLAGLFLQTTAAQQAPQDSAPNTTEKRSHQSIRASAGYPFGVGLAFEQYILKKNYSRSVYFDLRTRPSDNTPYDYEGAFGGHKVLESLFTVGINVGKIIPLESSSKRFNMKGGVALGWFSQPVNFRDNPDHGYLTDSHIYDLERKGVISILFQPTIEFVFGRNFGLGLGPFLNINRYWWIVGFNGSLLIGTLRNRLDESGHSYKN